MRALRTHSRRLPGRPVIVRLLFLLVLLAAPALGRAQTPEAPTRLEPVVVTPSRLEQQAGEAPASVTVITADVESGALALDRADRGRAGRRIGAVG